MRQEGHQALGDVMMYLSSPSLTEMTAHYNLEMGQGETKIDRGDSLVSAFPITNGERNRGDYNKSTLSYVCVVFLIKQNKRGGELGKSYCPAFHFFIRKKMGERARCKIIMLHVLCGTASSLFHL